MEIYKNVCCNAILPNNEITIVIPPPSDIDAKEGLYWRLLKHIMASKDHLNIGAT